MFLQRHVIISGIDDGIANTIFFSLAKSLMLFFFSTIWTNLQDSSLLYPFFDITFKSLYHFLPSFLSSPVLAFPLSSLSSISRRRDFPCKGTASGRSSSTALLTVPGCSRQPSANHRLAFSHPHSIAGQSRTNRALRFHSFGLGIPFHTDPCLLVLPSFSRCLSRIKNPSPTRSRRASRKGKQNKVQQFNYQSYAQQDFSNFNDTDRERQLSE